MILISEAPIDATELLSTFEKETDDAGAIVTFSGQVRSSSSNGSVTSLTLQAYSPMTEEGIKVAVKEAMSRWSLSKTCVVHRIGEMATGETIVFVATASAHRRAAFEAADFLMDYLKTKAVFWKKEMTTSGETWIEPRQEDYHDAKRWAQEHSN